jgi:hypothetical protein
LIDRVERDYTEGRGSALRLAVLNNTKFSRREEFKTVSDWWKAQARKGPERKEESRSAYLLFLQYTK